MIRTRVLVTGRVIRFGMLGELVLNGGSVIRLIASVLWEDGGGREPVCSLYEVYKRFD